MGMDLMNIMKQVQNVQKKATIMQEELANLEVTGGLKIPGLFK